MKIFISLLVVTLLVNCTRKESSSPVLLKIGNNTINEKDFSLYLMDEAKNYNSVFLKDPNIVKKIKDSVVLNLIVEEMLISWGRQQKILMSPEEVDEKIKEQIKSYPDEQAFKRVYSELKLQKDILRRRTQVLWIKDQLIKNFTQSIQTEDNEVKSYYKKNRSEFKQPSKIKLQQIVVKTELEAKKLYASLKNGASFGKLASEYSLGAESDNGGIIGWIEKGTLPVFDAAFNSPVRRLIAPKKSPYGYHIFRVLERKRGRQLPLNEVKQRISNKLKASLAKEKYTNWLETQIHRVKVEKNEEALRGIQIDVQSDS